jgi:hypothetical protein
MVIKNNSTVTPLNHLQRIVQQKASQRYTNNEEKMQQHFLIFWKNHAWGLISAPLR